MTTATSTLLICERNRDHVFDKSEAGVHRDCVVTDPYPMYENWLACPECGCTDLIDAAHCEGCGEAYSIDDLNADGLCPECTARPDEPTMINEGRD